MTKSRKTAPASSIPIVPAPGPLPAGMQLPAWLAPGEAADRLYDVREAGVTALDLALLRPRAKDRPNSTLELAYAKLNPIRPAAGSPQTRCGLPATARDYRLVMAPTAPDPISIVRLFGDYDAVTPDNQRLLAAVLTMRFDRDRPLHDSVDELLCFTSLHVARERQLTSLMVIHHPGDQAASEAPHAHVLVLARTHHAAGWGPVHPDLAEDQHGAWADDWTSFREAWRRGPLA